MKKIFIILLMCFTFICKGQNLVLNPSFEDTIPCSIFPINNFFQLPCTGWYWASGGSVDYFNEQYHYADCPSSPAPTNPAGYQYARTGIAYCGFALYLAPIFQPNGYRENLGGQLLDTLKQGHTYCVSFYVVKSDSGKYYTSDIGMYLSPDSSVDYSTSLNLPYTPQIINTNGIIYDTLNWTQISGTYVAGGGEKYFIIGNFNNDANTTLDSNNQINNPNTAFSYYYIDDVSVIDCTVGINEIENLKDKIKLMPNPFSQITMLSFNVEDENAKVLIKLFNALGTQLLEMKPDGSSSIPLKMDQYHNGIYYCQFYVNDKLQDTKKLVLIK